MTKRLSVGLPGVYLIKNKINGKVYVGSASKGIRRRLTCHLSMLRNGNHHSSHLQNAWNKYGEDSFQFMVKENCAPDDCVEREQFWIDTFKSADCRYGYNRCPNARSSLGVKMPFRNLPKPQCKKISFALKVYLATPKGKAEHKKRVATANYTKGLHSKIAKELWADASYRGNQSRWINSKERKRISSDTSRRFWDDAENRNRMSKVHKGLWTSKKREEVAEQFRKLWADPAYRERMMRSRRGRQRNANGQYAPGESI